MTGLELQIRPPFRRVHAVMYLVTTAAIASPTVLLVWGSQIPMSPDRRTEMLVGFAVIGAMSLVGLAIYWLA